MFFMNPVVVFRLNPDGSAYLSNPDNNEILPLNSLTTVIYKMLFEGLGREEILTRLLNENRSSVELEEQFDRFLDQLRAKGCIGLPISRGGGY